MKICPRCTELKSVDDFYKGNGYCKPCWNAYIKARELVHPRRTTAKDYYRRIKLEVMAGYGGKCACCGEDNPSFLTLNHVHGGGGAHRKKVGANGHYVDALKRDFPTEYRVLCYNCNCSGAHRGDGVCAHLLPKLTLDEHFATRY